MDVYFHEISITAEAATVHDSSVLRTTHITGSANHVLTRQVDNSSTSTMGDCKTSRQSYECHNKNQEQERGSCTRVVLRDLGDKWYVVSSFFMSRVANMYASLNQTAAANKGSQQVTDAHT